MAAPSKEDVLTIEKSKPPRSAAAKRTASFSDEERAAMKEYAAELKAAARRGSSEADGEADVQAKIAQMQEPDRRIAERVHALVKAAAPGLSPRTWYGMPAYSHDGNVVCYLQSAGKFKARYATLGFSDKACLDDGEMWPVAFALKQLGPAEEARIIALIKKALG